MFFCCNALDFLALLPVDCCYAFDAFEFQPLLPTTFLLLRSWLSNITSGYVSAATLLAFHHAPVLLITYPYVVATLLDFQLNFHL